MYRLSEDLIAYPDIIEYKVVKELFLNKGSELGVVVSESRKKNLMRKLSNKFPEINFITYQYNKVFNVSKHISHKQSRSEFLRVQIRAELMTIFHIYLTSF